MILKPLFRSSPLGILFRILVLLVLPFYFFVAVTSVLWVRSDAESDLTNDTLLLVEAVRATMTTHTAMLMSVGEGLLSLKAIESPENGRELIERTVQADPGMAGFGLARSDGQLVLVSRAPPGAKLPNLISDEQSRASFHEAIESGKIHAGRAYFFQTLNQWVIPIRIALRDATGQVRAVMTAGYRIEGGTAAWARMSLGPGVSVLLMHDDGYRLYQHPLSGEDKSALYKRAYGQPVESALMAKLRALPEQSGVFEVNVDGSEMLGAWQRLNEYGLYALTMKPLHQVQISQWTSLVTPTLWLLAFLIGGYVVYRHTSRLQLANDTEKERTHTALVRSEGLLRLSQEAARMGTYVTNLTNGRWESSETLDKIFGIDKKFNRDASGWVRLAHPSDREFLMTTLKRVFSCRSNFSHEYRIIRPCDGETRWVLVWGDIEYDGAGNPVRGVGALLDMTERKQVEAALRQSEDRYREIFNAVDVAIFMHDARTGAIVDVNQRMCEMYGYSYEQALACGPDDLSAGTPPYSAAEAIEKIKLTIDEGPQTFDWIARKSNGQQFWTSVSLRFARIGADDRILAAVRDITEQKQAASQIQTLAFSDPLTGLPNRRLLMDRLEQAMASATRHGHQDALLFVDLDDFKTLNDTLGHDKGDLLLKQIAQRLIACVREGDTVARLSGDEFIVLLEDLSEGAQDAATQAQTVGGKILDALGQPYQLNGHGHHSTASIGVTLFGGAQRENIEEPLKRAELAMYQAKRAGRGTLRFFEPEMRTAVNTRATLEADLRQAVTRGQFLLYYQPQCSGDRNLLGVEALVRWQHPERGLVSPVEFIPVAETSGLILPLGRWVLRAACQQLATWAARPGMADLTMSVNVSAREFRQPDFVEEVVTILEATGANPMRLKLELTESVLVDNVEDIIAKMNALKAQGVSFSLDDFGTGYSSLSYLKRLPLDQLKIDQGFVRDILTDPNDAAIAKMVLVLAATLGLTVVAEGVETEAQRWFLASMGCDNYQGYLFSRPLPIDEFEMFARDR